ncbi:MBOAT family O-acyltransferase [Desulfovibrio ferrophilus]|uniref:MBOAT family O-acyltransferase n=1 Tax=Desulfovibrio ferrophilus TaxID=241368 RepID=UPI000F819EFD|nr:MBOAT family O-acyltransferase [Desulfovibrio ferrophilus]
MQFTQIEFIIFFFCVLGLCTWVKSTPLRLRVILFSNALFYAYWDVRLLGLILLQAFSDFIIAKAINNSNGPCTKRLTIAGVAVPLLILGFFKYYNFFIGSALALFTDLQIDSRTLNIIIPLGISFTTFQSISYIIDVSQKKISPCTSYIDYATYFTFFPKIAAGPITRATTFLPQFNNLPAPNINDLSAGFRLFAIGMFKKVFLADHLGAYINFIWPNATAFDGLTLWIASAAYTLQIYFDFSGYSDMAIGLARMLGIRINTNFNFPYLATNISEFWRRWHISLSTWIRDYLYIPLGGNRKGPLRTHVNLLTAMLLCGLWHGPTWLFVIWGGYHGILLSVHRNINFKPLPSTKFQTRLKNTVKILTTLFSVHIGWILFRSSSLSEALGIMRGMFTLQDGVQWVHPFVIFIIIGTVAFHVLVNTSKSLFLLPEKAWYTPFALCSMIWLTIVYFPTHFSPFIYAQF